MAQKYLITANNGKLYTYEPGGSFVEFNPQCALVGGSPRGAFSFDGQIFIQNSGSPYTAQKFNGTSWSSVGNLQGNNTQHIHGSALNNIYMAPSSGTILWKWDGTTWALVASFTAGSANWISVLADDDVWVNGSTSGYTLMHWDGTSWINHWAQINADFGGYPGAMVALWAADPEFVCICIWRAGNHTSRVLVYDGAHWSQLGGVFPAGGSSLYSDKYIRSIWGSGRNDIWVAGENYTSGNDSVLHWDGVSWTYQIDFSLVGGSQVENGLGHMGLTGLSGAVSSATQELLRIACWTANKVWRSPDGGTTWENLSTQWASEVGATVIAQSVTELFPHIEPPYISSISPADGSLISTTQPITFTTNCDLNDVDLSSIIIQYNGSIIFSSSVWTAGWTDSSYVIGGVNGYIFTLISDTPFDIELVVIDIYVENLNGDGLTTSLTYTLILSETDNLYFIGHSLDVSSIQTVGVPSPDNVWNQYDEFGLLVDTKRIKGETNWSYKRRIQDSYIHRANSSYRGLVYSITRDLGLSLYQPIVINPKLNSQGNFFPADPYVLFNGPYLYLYSDYKNEVIDSIIDRHEVGGNFNHLLSLIEYINTTTYFTAELVSSSLARDCSMVILNQSNREEVEQEAYQSQVIQLNHHRVVRGSCIFLHDFNTYLIEVRENYLVSKPGEYHINYNKGIITSYWMPNIETSIRYKFTDHPFKPWASPVILNSITNEDYKKKLFKQVLQDDGTYTNGQLTPLGASIITELLSVSAMYWGI